MVTRGSHHSRVGIPKIRRTAFDLSYEKKFTCRFGELIPVMCDEVVPGDHFTIGCEDVVRFQPMVAPLLHEVNVTCHYFFVPYRLLWERWELFISGGPDGNFNEPLPRYPIINCNMFSLWDYFGFPLGTSGGGNTHWQDTGSNMTPLAFPLRAYNFIWNEYYRDENFQAKIGLSSWDDTTQYDTSLLDNNFYVLTRAWVKDYFTSALPFQQRGDPVAFPISGTLPVEFSNYVAGDLNQGQVYIPGAPGSTIPTFSGNDAVVFQDSVADGVQVRVGPANVNLEEGVSFDVNQLRLAVQLQKWKERNARGGIRYTELLRSHFGVTPRDDRLQRPEYIGGSKSPVVISEVLQTGASNGNDPVGQNTPQATMAGHGLVASGNFIGKYFVKEYGLIMGIMSVTPTPSYEDGIDRQWLRYTNTDFYWPEFVNLSEQGIYNAEIFAQGDQIPTSGTFLDTEDGTVWGYQPQYDEMRIKRNMVCSEMRVNVSGGEQSLSYWHMGRAFSSLPPLSSQFISMQPSEDQFTRPFAVTSARPLIVSHANRIKAVRPIPYIGEPGLVDHH